MNKLPSNKVLQTAIIEVLEKLGGEASTKEINDAVKSYLDIPETIINIEHPDGLCTLYDYKMRWSRTALKGQIKNVKRGLWKLEK